MDDSALKQLRWLVESGVDEAVDAEARDRFSPPQPEPERPPVPSATPEIAKPPTAPVAAAPARLEAFFVPQAASAVHERYRPRASGDECRCV